MPDLGGFQPLTDVLRGTNLTDAQRRPALNIGDEVRSEVRSAGPAPLSFLRILEIRQFQRPLTIGIALLDVGGELLVEQNLSKRWFKGALRFGVDEMSEGHQEAVLDCCHAIAQIYRRTDLRFRYANSVHELYGEISISVVKGEPLSHDDVLPDYLPHPDFVPRDGRCIAVTASNVFGTRAFRGKYGYAGIGVRTYQPEIDARRLAATTLEPLEFHVTSDARTFLHCRDIPAETPPTERVFLRVFGAPISVNELAARYRDALADGDLWRCAGLPAPSSREKHLPLETQAARYVHALRSIPAMLHRSSSPS